MNEITGDVSGNVVQADTITGDIHFHQAPAPTRHDLPRRTTRFVGRAEAVRDLLDRLTARPAGVHVIDGMPGVGKTELALHVADAAAEHFPDGAVFLDLAGYSPGLEATSPAQALHLLLGHLGRTPTNEQHDPAVLKTLWRAECARRRLLIVLDNVHDKDQVAPLVPDSPGCVVLITSRRKLIGLPGVVPFPLEPPPPDEARELLLSLAASTDDAGVDRIVNLCAQLPLAVAIAASMLVHDSGYTATALADDLAAERRHLEDLDDGDGSLHIAVHASILLSFQHLTDAQKQAFLLCGWHPGPEVTEPALAVLRGTTHPEQDCVVRLSDPELALSRRLLRELVNRNLLQPQHGRYRMHDLVRSSARLIGAPWDELRRHALNHLVLACSATLQQVETKRFGGRLAASRRADAPLMVLADLGAATRWILREHENLLALIDATDHGSVVVSQFLAPQLRDLGLVDDARRCYEDTESAYRHLGADNGRAYAIRGLGQLSVLRGDYQAATRHYQRARKISRSRNDTFGQALALRGFGTIARLTDQVDKACDCLRQARALFKAALRSSEANVVVWREYGATLSDLGKVEDARGNTGTAVDLFEAARQAYVRAGDLGAQYALFPLLAGIARDRGNLALARQYCDELLEYARHTGDRDGEAEARWELGQVAKAEGDTRAAIGMFERVAELRPVETRPVEHARALLGLADAERLDGRLEAARAHFDETRRLCLEFQDQDGVAQADIGLGDLAEAGGDLALARECWQRALAIAEGIGVEFVVRKSRSRLATLS